MPYVNVDPNTSVRYIKILGTHADLESQVKSRDNYTCYICQRRLPPMDLTVDHVVPQKKGGKTTEENLKCCCLKCNRMKAYFTYSEALVNVIRNELKEQGLL